MTNPTNYALSSLSSTGYGTPSGIGDDSFLLLQDGSSFLLLQDGASKLILERGITTVVNYTKGSFQPTNYS